MTRPRDIADGINRIDTSAADATAITIDANENVGIGTTSPSSFAKLHLSSTGTTGLYADGSQTSDANIFDFVVRNGTDSVTAISSKRTGANDAAALLFSTQATGGSLTERMRLDSSGNVGIGTSSPTFSFVSPCLQVEADSASVAALVTSSSSDGFSSVGLYSGVSSSDNPAIAFQNDLRFGVTNDAGVGAFSEKMRIDSSGNLLVGTTTVTTGKVNIVQASNSLGAYVFASDSASYTSTVFAAQGNRLTTNRTYKLADFVNPNGTGRCFIYDSGDLENTNNSYGSLSDVKLKTDIVDATSQWDDIKALRFRKYKLTADPEQRVQMGLIAQELEATSPNLVDESVDRDFDGNDLGTTTKSIKYSILYIKAVKALQEAITKIETLETQNASLEARIEALENA